MSKYSFKQAAAILLESILSSGNSPDKVIAETLRLPPYRHFGTRDRRALFDLVYAILRFRRFLTETAPHPDWPEIIENALSLGGNSAKILTKKVDFVAALKGADQPTGITKAALHELPDWLEARLQAQYGSRRLESMATALWQPASLDLRVNTLKTSREKVLSQLLQAGYGVEEMPWSPWGLRLDPPVGLKDHALYREGMVEIQDEGSQLISLLVGARRNEWIVDFCAGAGGKTLALGAMMRGHGRLYALDDSASRLSQMEPRLKRAGLKGVVMQTIEGLDDSRLKRWHERVDRVLVDAPCSGLGTLKRNPALKWQYEEKDIVAFSHRQLAILKRAAQLVKPGGLLVYATCSILQQENEGVVEQFLDEVPTFERDSVGNYLKKQDIEGFDDQDFRMLPDQSPSGGFYAARLKKRSE